MRAPGSGPLGPTHYPPARATRRPPPTRATPESRGGAEPQLSLYGSSSGFKLTPRDTGFKIQDLYDSGVKHHVSRLSVTVFSWRICERSGAGFQECAPPPRVSASISNSATPRLNLRQLLSEPVPFHLRRLPAQASRLRGRSGKRPWWHKDSSRSEQPGDKVTIPGRLVGDGGEGKLP